MKKILVTIMLSFVILGLQAQENKTIGVNAYVDFEPTIKEFRANVILQLDGWGYNSPTRFSSLKELKNSFFEKIEKKGVNRTKFTETPMMIVESHSGYKASMVSLTLKTTNQDDLISLTKTGMYVRIYNAYAVLKFTDDDYKKLTGMCLKKAKKSALVIAKQINKELDEVKSVGIDSSSKLDNKKISLSEIDDKQRLGLYVTYFIK